MSRLLTSRIAVLAAVLFVSAWVVCEQLIGLSIGTSIVIAGVLLAFAVSAQVFRVTHSGRQQAAGEAPGPRYSMRQRPHQKPVPRRPEVLITQRVQIIVDDGGIEIKTRIVSGADLWDPYLQMRWPTVAAIGFATDRYDPIISCYAWTVDRVRHHLADAGSLTRSEWARLGELIAEATRGRLILDLAARDNPRSLGPDW